MSQSKLPTMNPGLMTRHTTRWGATLVLLCGIVACSNTPLGMAPSTAKDLSRIQNVVVIYAENHSFDNMYGLFPGANGIANATSNQYTQLDHDGTPLRELVVFGSDGKPDPAYPRLPNKPFRIDAAPVNRSISDRVPSPTHAFYQNQEQINGGRNNMFAAVSKVGGWVMGHYDGSQFKMWKWAQEYTLADNFFMGAFGGSYLNHQWLVCACTPTFKDAATSARIQLDAQGKLIKRDTSPSANIGAMQPVTDETFQISPDGYSVNTAQPPYQPSNVTPSAGGNLALTKTSGVPRPPTPPQTSKTIGDTLSAKGISWAWYAGGWNAALADGMREPDAERVIIYSSKGPNAPNFQPHHQPFNYFANYAPGTTARAEHLKDEDDFLAAIGSGNLPAVSFFKPVGRDTQHPSYTNVITGDEHIAGLLEKLRASPQWKNMLVIVTYDENGGYWDHVPPPKADRWGPGSRIPTLLVGPMVKKGYVDSNQYDTTSILKFITRRFALEPLPGVRAQMGDLSGALE